MMALGVEVVIYPASQRAGHQMLVRDCQRRKLVARVSRASSWRLQRRAMPRRALQRRALQRGLPCEDAVQRAKVRFWVRASTGSQS